MQESVKLARKMSHDLGKNWLSEIEELNLHVIFRPIYKRSDSITTLNAIVVFIIFSYDNDSTWLNLKQDRFENKLKIWKGLEVDLNEHLISIAKNEIDSVNDVIVEYLIHQVTWEWNTIFTQLDYHSNMLRFVSKKTDTGKSTDVLDKDDNKHTLIEEYDAEKVSKINKEKGLLLERAIEAREKADTLLAKIRKEFVQMDNAVQQDFGFSPTDEKKIDAEKWRDFVRHTLVPAREAKKIKSSEAD